jgi:acyl-coenzyme A synthetase/AMP-(fatty) acid ligase
MKRAVICVPDPWNYIPLYENDYSLMIINPTSVPERNQYLIDNSDYSILVMLGMTKTRNGGDHGQEKVFWYTSGTTGDSKFCSFSQQQINTVVDNIIRNYDLSSNDRYVSILPLWHAHGQMFYWVAKKLACETHFLNVNRLTSLGQYRPTFITAIPDILKILLKQDFDDLRFVRSASSPLPNHLYTALREKFGVPVVEAFGMTETCSHCFTNPLHGEQRMGTVGLPDGVEARIEDSRLFVRGSQVYCNDWFDTGDLAEQDSAGYYRILGRATDRITVRTYKLDPLSLETRLYQTLPELSECAVFGTDSVKCLYVGPYDVNDIKQVLLSLGQYCWPSLIRQVDSIPKNNAGKVSRALLDSMY